MSEAPGTEVLETQSAPAKKLELFVLEIEIIKANDLIKADTFGKSDPYCKVIAANTGQVYQTKAIQKDLNPVWNERTQFSFFEACNELKIEVWDEDQGTKDDRIGDCTLDTSRFYDPDHNGYKGTLTLMHVKHGNVTLKVKGSHVDPVELEERAAKLAQESIIQKQQIGDQAAQITTLKQEQERLRNEREQVNMEKATLQTTKEGVCQQVTDEKAKAAGFAEDTQKVTAETAQICEQTKDRKAQAAQAKKKAEKDAKALESKEAEKETLLEELDKLRTQLRGM